MTLEELWQIEFDQSERRRKLIKPDMTKREATRFVYKALSMFLDPSMHQNKFIEEDFKGNPLSDPDKILCRKILSEIAESFKSKAAE